MDKKLPAQFSRAFKSADIRGVHNVEIDDDLAYRVARAMVDEFGYTSVLVAHDMRVSSPSLLEAFVKGVVDAGANAIPLGLITSPMFYFASASLKRAGVMITASHSPSNYNGLKLVHPGAVPFTTTAGLRALAGRVRRGIYREPTRRGRVMPRDIRYAFQSHITKGWRVTDLSTISIAADIGNGMASVLMPLLTEALPIKFSTLFADLDGRFPNRGSDPTLRHNQRHIRALLKQHPHDFGIAFDGDADRIAFLDEQGNAVNSASIAALVAREFLRKEPGARIATTILTSLVLPEVTTECGGEPVWAKDGHAFVKETMRAKKAVFGAEYSGHFYFRDFFYTDSVLLTLRHVLSAYVHAKAEGKTFSDMVAPFERYVQLEDEVIEVSDKAAAMRAVEQYLKERAPEKIRRFDGIWFSFGTAWGAVKPSVTEHALKVICESPRKAAARKLQDELVAFVRAHR
jgi:phosphomannomutase